MKNPLLITIATMLIWSACKRDEKKEPEVHYSYLSAEQRNKTPYFNNPAFDTLTFLSNKGDTFIFAKLKTDSFFIMTGGRPFPDHPGIYTYHQTLRNTYQTLKGNGKFEVRHAKLDNNGTSDLVTLNFNNLTLRIRDNFLNSNYNGDRYYDSITFNGNVFFKSILVYNNINDSNSGLGFVNSDFGFFHISDKIFDIQFNFNIK